MGGRGSSSGLGSGAGTQGITVTTKNGEKMTYYFERANGTTFYGTDPNSVTEETPLGMSMREFISRVEKNGGKVEKINRGKIKKEQEKYKKEYKNKPDYETGNAFNEHGWGAKQRKAVYRYRKTK